MSVQILSLSVQVIIPPGPVCTETFPKCRIRVFTPPFKGDAKQSVRLEGGGVRTFQLRDALILDKCNHNLVALGRLASEANVSTVIARDGTHLLFSDGQRAPLINQGCIICIAY